MQQRCLILGAGHTKPKRQMWTTLSAPEDQTTWVTLDNNPDCHPDVLFDLDNMECGKELPFGGETFDEIHAYEVMEHYGSQGDYKGFFTGMRELWRVLKSGGVLFGTCPSPDSDWAWGDPGHRRVISGCTLVFLSPRMYQALGSAPNSDYRRLVQPCWWDVDCEKKGDHTQFALAKVRLVE